MLGAKSFCQLTDDLMIRAAALGRINDLGAERNVLMASCLVDVIVLKEHGGGQYDVCHLGGFGHGLLMHADKEILARKTLMHPVEIRCHRHGIGVLNKECSDGRTVFDILLVSGQDSPNTGLIQHPHIRVQMVSPSSSVLSQW